MPRKKELTPKELFDWASEYARAHGGRCPTLKMATRRYGVSQAKIEELLDEGVPDGYIGLATGVRTDRGIGTFKTRGECLIEAYT